MGKNFFFKRPITILFTLIFCLFFLSKPVAAGDFRALKLAKFLFTYNSKLVTYSSDFVRLADKYNLDYRLIPAISGVESTFGRNFIDGTYNVYGWGGGVIKFDSWEDGIEKLAFGLKNNYIDKGAKTVEEIGYIYCPPNSVGWSQKVNYFMEKIENTDISEINLPLTI